MNDYLVSHHLNNRFPKEISNMVSNYIPRYVPTAPHYCAIMATKTTFETLFIRHYKHVMEYLLWYYYSFTKEKNNIYRFHYDFLLPDNVIEKIIAEQFFHTDDDYDENIKRILFSQEKYESIYKEFTDKINRTMNINDSEIIDLIDDFCIYILYNYHTIFTHFCKRCKMNNNMKNEFILGWKKYCDARKIAMRARRKSK